MIPFHRQRAVNEELEEFAQLNRIRPCFQNPALSAGIDIAVPRQLFQKLAQLVVAHIDMPSELLNGQGSAFFLRRIQKQQDFQHVVKPSARVESPAEGLALPIRQRRSQHRATQQQRPQQV